MKLIIFGEYPSKHVRAEWFPGFNHFFVNEYLQKDFEIIKAKCIDSRPPQKIYQYEDHIIQINANSLILFNPENNKSICFSTFYNLRQLKGDNKKFFNETLIKCFAGHYNDSLVSQEWGSTDKISPWYFRPHFWGNTLTRNKYNPSKCQAFFRGIFIKGSRQFIKTIQENHTEDPEINIKIGKMQPPKYAEELCASRCAVNAPGIRDMCYRDIDNFIMGVPTIRPRFTSRMLVEVPDEVYIPVDHDVISDRRRSRLHGMPANHKDLAESIISKWHEVKNDKIFLQNISNNAKEFAAQYFSKEAMAKNTFNLMKENNLF